MVLGLSYPGSTAESQMIRRGQAPGQGLVAACTRRRFLSRSSLRRPKTPSEIGFEDDPAICVSRRIAEGGRGLGQPF